jgi:SAM-dependent methyltransferase
MSAAESVDSTARDAWNGSVADRHRSFSEVFSDALRGIPCTVHGISADDRAERVPVEDWLRPASRSDRMLLDHCRGATLDIGCGPGRMSAHLAQHGHYVLGVDIVREAVEQTRRRGVPVLRRNIFDPMPGEGTWDTVLLADGNIGIGGDPLALLRRSGELLGDDGRVVCDLGDPGTGLSVHAARIATRGRTSATFPWAKVGPDAIHSLAHGAGLAVQHVGECDRRWFAVLTR